jgi:hypothetical protein
LQHSTAGLMALLDSRFVGRSSSISRCHRDDPFPGMLGLKRNGC